MVDRLIHHGIDTSTVRVGTGDGGYACFLERIHPSKGLHQAIEVALLARMPLRTAAKMRSREDYEYFSAGIKPLLGPKAEYLGEFNTTDKYALLGGAVALLNSIQWPKPFGRVMIEALAIGIPVVSPPMVRPRKSSGPESPGACGPGCRGWSRRCWRPRSWTAAPAVCWSKSNSATNAWSQTT